MKTVNSVLFLSFLCLQVFGYAPYPCYVPVRKGPCYAYNPRFYYNIDTQTCEQFIHKGCLGNDNRFPTLEKCQATCGAEALRCFLPLAGGNCYTKERKYSYNRNTGKCERLSVSSCGGDKNQFDTIYECQAVCEKHDTGRSVDTYSGEST